MHEKTAVIRSARWRGESWRALMNVSGNMLALLPGQMQTEPEVHWAERKEC